MTSAIWSASVDSMAAFPVQTLVRFMQNHGMLSVASPIQWRVVKGGSDSYIAPMLAHMAERIRLDARIRSVSRSEGGVTITFAESPGAADFDDVVFACHGDQVLPLLADATAAEREILGALPRRSTKRCCTPTPGCCRNRRAPAPPGITCSAPIRMQPPSVTYDLNRLQGIAGCTTYCVTLNPRRPLDASKVIRRLEYRHPQFTLRVDRRAGTLDRGQRRQSHPLLRRLLAIRLPRRRGGVGAARRGGSRGALVTPEPRLFTSARSPIAATRQRRTSSAIRCSWRCSTSIASTN